MPHHAGILLTITIIGLSLGRLYDGLELRKPEQWRETVQLAMGNAKPADGWIFVHKMNELAFHHYGKGNNEEKITSIRPHIFEEFNWHHFINHPRHAGILNMDALSLFSKYYRRIWLIVSHEHDYRTGKKIDASVAVRYRLAEDGYQESLIERSSVHLYLLERSD